MKVRHKLYMGGNPAVEYEVVPTYHVVRGHDGLPVIIDAKDYEVVVEDDRWEDVTAECAINDRYELFHRKGLILNPMCGIAMQTYRLRTVLVPIYEPYTGQNLTLSKTRSVFIVERKVNP